MDNVIDAKQKGQQVKVTHIRPQPELVPDIDPFHSDEFCSKAIDLIENKLVDIGVVIPRGRLKQLSDVLPDIGKLYYAYVTMKLF